jgi:hypothetical protein
MPQVYACFSGFALATKERGDTGRVRVSAASGVYVTLCHPNGLFHGLGDFLMDLVRFSSENSMDWGSWDASSARVVGPNPVEGLSKVIAHG